MALRLILGNSGSGKSFQLYQHIIAESQQNPQKEYLVIVPEQFTMQTQKDLVTMHPNKGIMNIDVLSFARLAHRIFEEVGQSHRAVLDDEGKNLILRKIAGAYEKDLKVLGGNLKKQGYISEVKSVISEFAQYGVDGTDLEDLIGGMKENSYLAWKLTDIQILSEGFYRYLSDKYITKEELLYVLRQVAGKSEILKDAVIALDDCFAYNAEKLSGIDLIVIGTSDLEKSKDFFVTHMELNVVAEGTMDAASVKALYGQEGEAKYAMVMNNVNSTKLMLIEFSEKTGKTTREGFHAWDYGYFDVAWRCNDIDAMYEELTGAGYSFECEPFSYTTSWSGNAVAECVAYGPDGVPTTMILKTTQEFDTKFYNMVDAVLVVDDMASAVDWYTNVMGMELVYDAPVEKGLVDRVLGIEGTDITVRMGYFYGSYANGQSTLIEILDYSEPGVSMTEQGGSVPGNGGIFTQAFETKDLDKLLARCEAFGYKTASERTTVTLESVGEIDTVLVSGVNGTLYQFYQVK